MPKLISFYHQLFPNRIEKQLLVGSLVVVALVATRVLYLQSFKNIYLAWNLFLAWIPYAISVLWINSKRSQTRLESIFALLVWFIFLPNSPYIITDFIHLPSTVESVLWLDIIKLFLASALGLLWGMLSIFNVESWLKLHWNIQFKLIHRLLMFAILGYGVYMGRELRFNSWDLFIKPLDVLLYIKGSLCLPTLFFVIGIAGLQWLVYGFTKTNFKIE